ncbi:MAG: PEP-CTERM/exosortase system-associated acyltransferase [Gammaproteobacteria bacterium]|nr:PEP-CTERM/exosortase system-associated acyltransferase [Gammaproteobacteria bacterium]
MPNITDSFHAHLEARKAINDELKNNAYQVRYNVYCVERGYEDKSKFPDRLERDEFDDESAHAVVRHKESKKPVGVVRLVLPNKSNPDRRFPIETHFGRRFDMSVLKEFGYSRNNIAEVSRFAVSKLSLIQLQKQLAVDVGGNYSYLKRQDPRLLLPHISLGLIALLFAISDEHGIDYWFAAMEPSLSRLLTRLGIVFTPIGPVMNYHGERQPMIARVDDLLNTIAHSRKDFYRLIIDVSGIPASRHQRTKVRSDTKLSKAIALLRSALNS